MARRRDRSTSGRWTGAWLFALAGCSALEPPQPLAPPPDLTLRDVNVSQFHRGVLTARIATEELQYTRDTGHLVGRDGTLLPQTGSMAGGRLMAGLTEGSTQTGTADLSKMVQWIGPGGDEVNTASCKVDFVRQVAHGSEPVTLAGAGYTIQAQGFDSHMAGDTDIHLTGGVRVHLTEGEAAEGTPQ